MGDIFHKEDKEKQAEEQKKATLQAKVNNVFGVNNNSKFRTINPYLNRKGELVNPYLNYQQILDSPNVSQKAKNYITQATGLVQQRANNLTKTAVEKTATPSVKGTSTSVESSGDKNPVLQPTYSPPQTPGTGAYKDYVGKRITDTSKYNNGAAKGQCVWYVLGRASERNGKTITIGGNGNSMYHYAKDDAKVPASPNNLRGNMLLCYNKGTSSAGQKYGHVIFIEDVVGDTVYYTEGGSGYYKNGTDGVVKIATRQELMNGVNSAGSKIGSEPVGLIDLSKY